MIRVTVELDQYGLGQKITKLAEVHIANDGLSANPRFGSYKVRSVHKRTGRTVRSSVVLEHPRLSNHVLVLVRKALQAMKY